MLKLFQSQIADKQKELSDVAQEQLSKEMVQKVKQACSDKCVEASNNQCNPAALASLCMYGPSNVLNTVLTERGLTYRLQGGVVFITKGTKQNQPNGASQDTALRADPER